MMFADTPPCPKNPDGAHVWAMFPGGYGCHLCETWVFRPRIGHYVERYPVGLIGTHPLVPIP